MPCLIRMVTGAYQGLNLVGLFKMLYFSKSDYIQIRIRYILQCVIFISLYNILGWWLISQQVQHFTPTKEVQISKIFSNWSECELIFCILGPISTKKLRFLLLRETPPPATPLFTCNSKAKSRDFIDFHCIIKSIRDVYF